MLRKLWLNIRSRIGNSSIRVRILSLLVKKWRHLVVSKRSEICVEGYPRSANTFLIALLMQSKRGELKHASHTHWSGNLLLAKRFNVPAIVLIRDPEGCVTSNAVFEPSVSLKRHLLDYINFYQTLMPDKGCFLIVDFKDVINHHNLVINRLRCFTGEKYVDIDLTDPVVKRNIDNLLKKWHFGRSRSKGEDPEQTIARPSDVRECIKLDVMERIKHDPELVVLMARAKSLYDVFKEN